MRSWFWKRTHFDDIDDLEQLQALEQDLWELEEAVDAYEWRRRMVRLYRRMWEVDPSEDKSRYANTISRLLLELGTDLKMNQMQLGQARKYFRELIRWKSPAPVPIAHYRLGFIAYTERDWDQVIRSLEQALCGMRDAHHPIDPWARLSPSQELRAHVALAKAYEHKRREAAGQVRRLYGDGSGMDDTDRYWVEQLGGWEEETGAFICIGETARRIDEAEFRRLKSRTDTVVLDCSEPGFARLWVAGTGSPITGRNLDVLRILITSRGPVTDAELEGRLGSRQPAVYIFRLRQYLSDTFGLPGDAVETVRETRLNRKLSEEIAALTKTGIKESEAVEAASSRAIEHGRGYRWTLPNSFVIYRDDDPEYLFLYG